MNLPGNESIMVKANNYVTADQIASNKWFPITKVPAILFAKVGAAVLLNRKRLCGTPFLLDNNTMSYSLDPSIWVTNFAHALFETLDLTQLVQVGALPSYGKKDVEAIHISIPTLPEQEKIGNLFYLLENAIALHQKKLKHFKNLKESLLQNMFPREGEIFPRLRFPEFTDAWEQCELGSLAEVTKLAGFEFTKYVNYSDNGTIIALRGLNIKEGLLDLKDVKYIDGSDLSKLARSKLFVDDIVFTYVGTVGEVALIPQNDRFYLAPNVARIRINKPLSSAFLACQLGSPFFYQRIIFPLIATSSQPALSMQNIRKFNLGLPQLEEQEKIASLFAQIGNVITLHQRELPYL